MPVHFTFPVGRRIGGSRSTSFHFAKIGGFSFSPMSIEVSCAVWNWSKQKGSHLLLLVAIADYANAEGIAWPSVASLSRRTRMGERYVQKMLREIEADGEIQTVKRTQTSNVYRVTVSARETGSLAPGGGELGFTGGVNQGSPGGELGFTGGVNQGSPDPSVEPSVNRHMNPKRSAKPVGVTVIPLLLSTDEFADAWKDWLQHRKEIKHAIAPGSQTERGQLRQLEQWGVERAIAAIRFTIFKGWQGLKEPDERQSRDASGVIGKRSSMA